MMHVEYQSSCAGCGVASMTPSGLPPITWVKGEDGKYRCHRCLGITVWEAMAKKHEA